MASRRPPSQPSIPASNRPMFLDAAGAEIRFQRVAAAGGHGGVVGEPRVRPVVAGQDGQRETLRAGGLVQPLEPVAPIVEPAEAAHEHEARLGGGVLDVEIDRQRVLQPSQRGQTQRKARAARTPARRRAPRGRNRRTRARRRPPAALGQPVRRRLSLAVRSEGTVAPGREVHVIARSDSPLRRPSRWYVEDTVEADHDERARPAPSAGYQAGS